MRPRLAGWGSSGSISAHSASLMSVSQHRPILLVEYIKAGHEPIAGLLSGYGYRVFTSGMNILAVHEADPTI
ncbi:MAG TPA: hypothetical protein VK439_06420, partial [Rubrivivax sp.]|nr:hypothetical protein [Rubrivivax sp.]